MTKGADIPLLFSLSKKFKMNFFDRANAASHFETLQNGASQKALKNKAFYVAADQIRGGSCPLELPRCSVV